MADPNEAQEPTQRPQGGGVLTRQLGPLKAWQWAALVGVGGGVWFFLRNRGKPAADGAQGDYGDQVGDPGALGGAPGQQGATGSPGVKGDTGDKGDKGAPGTMPPTKSKPKGGQSVRGSTVNSKNYPAQIYALTQQGKSLVTFATIRNGRISGKNLGKSGAPVYALINTGFGPVWRQYFDPRQLPNGTKIATLPQFKSDIQGGGKAA